MVDQTIVKKISQKINGARKILLLGHANPRQDGDSLGAVLAVAHYLKSINKDFTIFSLYPAPENLSYLPGAHKMETNTEKINILEFDLIIMLDFSELRNSGLPEKLAQAKAAGIFFIIIDHHPGEAELADLAVVRETASSTCEILYNILTGLDGEITKDIATCLLTGILTDTQNFTNAGTTFTALQISSELLKRGAHLQEITAHTWQNKDLPILRLWGKILLRLHEDSKTGLVTTAITLKDLAEEQLSPEAVDGVVNFLNNLGTAKAVLLLKEETGGKVKGSLRTTKENIDVRKIAQRYGGGGHRKAAGFLIPGHIVRTEEGWKVVE